MDVSLSELRVLVRDREAWHAAIHGVAKSGTRLSDWTELNWTQEYKKGLALDKLVLSMLQTRIKFKLMIRMNLKYFYTPEILIIDYNYIENICPVMLPEMTPGMYHTALIILV